MGEGGTTRIGIVNLVASFLPSNAGSGGSVAEYQSANKNLKESNSLCFVQENESK